MSSDKKRPLEEARAVAKKFYELFPPDVYERWVVAGSIRRLCEEVGDIEFVVIPKWGERDVRPPGEMFAQLRVVNLVWHQLDQLVDKGIVSRDLGDGKTSYGDLKRAVRFEDFQVEIYTADAMNFGNMFAIRTGPWQYSRMLVTSLKRTGRRQRDGYLFDESNNLQPCPEESDFFKMCRVRWVRPERRKAE